MGYTQAELARGIGVSQQAVFAYELGDRRISILVLVKLANALGLSVEEMIGLKAPPRARPRRLSPRTIRHAERLQTLPRTAQRFVIRIIDTLIEHSTANATSAYRACPARGRPLHRPSRWTTHLHRAAANA